MSVCPVKLSGRLDTFLLCTAAIAALNSKDNTNVVVVIHLGGSMNDLMDITGMRDTPELSELKGKKKKLS